MTDTTVAGPIVRKVPTGIPGLDEITYGGLPDGRPTLVCRGPGSGQTLVGITFLVNGALRFGEPGVLMSFEQNAEAPTLIKKLPLPLRRVIGDLSSTERVLLGLDLRHA